MCSQASITLLLVLLLAMPAAASQYRSRELAAPADSAVVQKSIGQLEQELGSIADNYSRASTARYLARHFSSENDAGKAIRYYREALAGDGLSDYAKQDVLAELATVQWQARQYQGVVDSIDQRQALGGKADARLLILQAMAYHQLGRSGQAVASADAAWAAAENPSDDLLKQLLFVYYHSRHYDSAQRVQTRWLARYPNDLAGWRQLAAIHLKQQQPARAADALALAYGQSLPLQQDDILRLAALYQQTGNPYAAARVLENALQNGGVTASASHWDTLFRYWLQAREKAQAIAALQQALALQPDIDRYLHLAQLQMEAEQWQAMKQSVETACRIALPDRVVSRANLLLGISELKLGNRAEARRAFINATLIGGEGEQAASWLQYMEAEQADEQETAGFGGICTPKWARTEARQLTIASARPAAEKVDEQAVQYTIKTSEEQTLVVGSYTLAVSDMEKRLLPLAMKLGTDVVKNRGRISGNMHFIFPEPIQPGSEVISFQMAFPVSKAPDMLGRYRLREDKGYQSASMLYTGPPEGLPGAWLKLYRQVVADGHSVAKESRQIVLQPEKASRDSITLELQLGLE